MDKSINQADLPQSKEIIIPVKFNKETRELTLDEATILAQKGLKFEAIEKDYNALKQLAVNNNRSVPAFIAELINKDRENRKHRLTEKCGGNEELAEHILQLEAGKENDLNLSEVRENFSEIKSLEDLPLEVVESAQIKGTLLLDEYLRHLLKQKRDAQNAIKQQKNAEKAGTGSLLSQKNKQGSYTEEFLRGLWQ